MHILHSRHYMRYFISFNSPNNSQTSCCPDFTDMETQKSQVTEERF